MSQSIFVADLSALGLPLPESAEALAEIVFPNQERPADTGGKFVRWAQAVMRELSPGDSEGQDPWPLSLIEQARGITSAVWHLEHARDQQMEAIVAMVQNAKTLGLCLYDPQLGVAFLSDGKVLPQSMEASWHNDVRRLKQQPKRPTKGQKAKEMRAWLTQELAPFEFVRDEPHDMAAEGIGFQRFVANGRQCLSASVCKDWYQFHVGYSLYGWCDQLEAIYQAADVVTPGSSTYLIKPIDIRPCEPWVKVETQADTGLFLRRLLEVDIPFLDRCSTVAGLHAICNRPGGGSSAEKRMTRKRYTSLVVAHLMEDQESFQLRLAEFHKDAHRELAEPRYPNAKFRDPVAQLDRLVRYLRDQVPPLDEAARRLPTG